MPVGHAKLGHRERLPAPEPSDDIAFARGYTLAGVRSQAFLHRQKPSFFGLNLAAGFCDNTGAWHAADMSTVARAAGPPHYPVMGRHGLGTIRTAGTRLMERAGTSHLGAGAMQLRIIDRNRVIPAPTRGHRRRPSPQQSG